MNQASLSLGASRAEHAAMINGHNYAWNQYAVNHEAIFAENGLKKFVAVDGEGKIQAQNSDKLVLNAEIKKGLYGNASLRHEDFMTIQAVITDIRRRKLNGISDLEAAGLAFGVSITDQIIGTENVSGFSSAKQEQNPSGYDNDALVFGEIYVPNPITHKSFTVPFRQTGFEYLRSMGLSESARMVAERLEETLFNGNADIKVNFNGALQSIYGYTDHPNRGTSTISNWASISENDKIVNEVIAKIGIMFKDQVALR